MKGWLKKVTMPFIAVTLPMFPFEIFMGFVFLNIINNLSEAPSLLPLNANFYR